MMRRILLLSILSLTDTFGVALADIQVQGYLNSAAMENLAADPGCAPASTCPDGRIYWNTTAGEPRIWNGATWEEMLVGTSTVPDPLQLGDNNATTPTYSFSGDTNDGLFNDGTDPAIASGGSARMTWGTSITTFTEPLKGPNGSVANPTYSFTNETDMGFMRHAADQIGIVTEGADSGYLSRGAWVLDSDDTARISINSSNDMDSFLRVRTLGAAGAADSVIEFGDTDDTDRGRILYDHGDDSMDFVTATTTRMVIETDHIDTNLEIRAPLGSVTNPTYTFDSPDDQDGFWHDGTNMQMSADGVLSWTFGTGTNRSELELQVPTSVSSGPTYTFTGDTDSGLFGSTGSNPVGLVKNGTILVSWSGDTTLGTNVRVGSSSTATNPCINVSGSGNRNFRACSSLRRLKKNIEPITDDEVERLFDLVPVSYEWKENGYVNYGFIAEEVEEALPILSTYDEEGDLLGLHYNHMPALTLAALKVERKKRHDLESVVANLISRIESLEASQ